MLEFVAETARDAGLEDYRVVVNVGAGRRADGLPPALARPRRPASARLARHEPDRAASRRSSRRCAARDDERRDALRLILSSLRSAEKELQRPLPDDEELQVLQRERKKRVEAAEAFRAGGREEQADEEDASSRCSRSSCPSRSPRTSSRRSSTT